MALFLSFLAYSTGHLISPIFRLTYSVRSYIFRQMSELHPRFRKRKLADKTVIVELPEPQDADEQIATAAAAYFAADRIRQVRPRRGSLFDIENYDQLAKRLEREIPLAVIANALPQIKIELPKNKHQNINTQLSLPRIPGIAQQLEFNEKGVLEATALVGARIVRRVRTAE